MLSSLKIIRYFWVLGFISFFGFAAEAGPGDGITRERLQTQPVESFRRMAQGLRDPNMSWAQCQEMMRRVSAEVSAFDPSRINPDFIRAASLDSGRNPRAWMPAVATDLDAARFELMHRWQRDAHVWKPDSSANPQTETQLSPSEVEQYLGTLRALRGLAEEMRFYSGPIVNSLADESRGKKASSRSERYSPQPEFLLNPKLYPPGTERAAYLSSGELDLSSILQSGDVIITRSRPTHAHDESGTAISPVIAGIASGTAMDSQFSHALMVYRGHGEDTAGDLAIEPLIETDTKLRPLSEFALRDWGRVLVLRYIDPKAAERGAWMEKTILANQLKRGIEAIYNSHMVDLDDICPRTEVPDHIPTMMCSQPGRLGIQLGTGGINPIIYQSRIAFKEPWFPEYMLQIGNNRKVDHPGNYEVSPYFVPVFEYRDSALAHEARLADVVFNWLANKFNSGYRVRSNFAAQFKSRVGYPLRRLPEPLLGLPWLRSTIRDGFSRGLSKPQIEIFTALQNLFDRLYVELRRRDDAYILDGDRAGMMMSNAQLDAVLSDLYARNVNDVQYWLYDHRAEMEAHRYQQRMQRGQPQGSDWFLTHLGPPN